MLTLALTLVFAAQNLPCPLAADLPRDAAMPVQEAGDGLWIGGLAFTADDVESATVVKEPISDAWAVDLVFTPAGNAKFIRAQQCGVGKPIEISIDRRVISRPVLYEPILGGKARLTGGNMGREEVEAMARQIATRRG
ncbi:SecDF P1 head subdomain-containing protein [Sphingomonas sp. CJ20]